MYSLNDLCFSHSARKSYSTRSQSSVNSVYVLLFCISDLSPVPARGSECSFSAAKSKTAEAECVFVQHGVCAPSHIGQYSFFFFYY